MLLLGIDLGTSSIKTSVVDAATQKIIASASYPEIEVPIISLQQGWAEQSADMWWENVQQAILKCHSQKNIILKILQLSALPIKCMAWCW